MAGLGINFAIPGIPAMPSLSLASSSSAAMNQNGATFAASGAGDWSVNLGGSGVALQSASGGSINWLLIAAAVGGAWFLLRK